MREEKKHITVEHPISAISVHTYACRFVYMLHSLQKFNSALKHKTQLKKVFETFTADVWKLEMFCAALLSTDFYMHHVIS